MRKFGNIEESNFLLLYERAIKSYRDCINNKDNSFLSEEVNIPLEEIKVVEKDIKIVFMSNNFKEPTFEVCLLLFDQKMEIGKYTYIESEEKTAIDDYLVFY